MSLPSSTGRSVRSAQKTYYELLGITPDASADDIARAYQREQDRYDLGEARALGDEFHRVAEIRRAELLQAFSTLHDPQRRLAYDREHGLTPPAVVDRQRISGREIVYLVGGIVLALLMLAGVWTWRGGDTSSGPAVSEVNFPAKPIVLRTLDGGRFDLAEHRGDVVLVNFWRTDCAPCKEETPDLQAAYRALSDEGLVIVGVNLYDGEVDLGRGEREVARFVNSYGVQYPIALDEAGEVARAYRLYPIPVSYFIDRSGNVRYIRIGQLTTADVEELFRRLAST
jgi:cytochrome c biogenesis protein CcmG, thiol:disulfide interchange protein DsbE